MKTRWLASLLISVLALAVPLAVEPIQAQSEQDTESRSEESQTDRIVLDEITVTAQRREEDLQDVPVSVTAFTGDDLELKNMTDAVNYLSQTPNVSFTEDGQVGSRGLSISIRGVNDLKTGENSVINSIGIYLDEFSVVSVANGTLNPELQDLERIEVLRGPQGTYFGRNSVGGALNLITRKPTGNASRRITVGGELYENAGEMGHAGAVFNAPLSEDFWLRGVVYLENSSGLVENIQPQAAEDSGHDTVNARLSGRWLPSDSTTIDLMVMYTDDQQGTDETVPSGVWDIDTVDTFGLGLPGSLLSPPDPGTGFWPGNRNRLSHDLDEHNDNSMTLAVLNLRREIDDRSAFQLVAGLIETDNSRLFDNDLIGGVDIVGRRNQDTGSSWSLEARFERSSDRFDWVAGGLFAQDDQERSTRIRVGSSAATPIEGVVLLPPPFVFPVGLCLQCNDKDFEVESAAVFGDLSVFLTERFSLIFGGRYTRDDVTTAIANATSLAPGLPFTNTMRADAANELSFNDFSPRVSVRYQPHDRVGIYALASKGYKAGGTSIGHDTNAPGQPALTVPFDEEELWNYELGLKSEWLNRRLRINAAAFVLDWSDLQLESFRFLTSGDLSSNFEQTINLDQADAAGFEIDFQARLSWSFTLSGGVGYVDTEIDCACGTELTGGFVVDLQGLEIPKAPRLTANVTADYRWTVGDGAAYLVAEFIHRDGQFSDVEALTWRQTRGRFTPNSGGGAFVPASATDFPFRTPDYGIVNLRLGLFRQAWDLAIFAENVLDKAYFTGTQENFGITGFRLRPHPRTVGANLSFNF